MGAFLFLYPMKHLRISQPPSHAESQLHQIGYVHSTQGLKGDLFIVVKASDISWFEDWETLILSPGSKQKTQSASSADVSFLSFDIASLREHKKQGKRGVVARLYELESCTDVEPLVGFEVWIPKSMLESKKGENIFLAEIEGFTVIDGKMGKIGAITGFSSNGAQDLLEVSFKGRTLLIPLVQAFIDRIASEERTIYMNVPEGLLDIE